MDDMDFDQLEAVLEAQQHQAEPESYQSSTTGSSTTYNDRQLLPSSNSCAAVTKSSRASNLDQDKGPHNNAVAGARYSAQRDDCDSSFRKSDAYGYYEVSNPHDFSPSPSRSHHTDSQSDHVETQVRGARENVRGYSYNQNSRRRRSWSRSPRASRRVCADSSSPPPNTVAMVSGSGSGGRRGSRRSISSSSLRRDRREDGGGDRGSTVGSRRVSRSRSGSLDRPPRGRSLRDETSGGHVASWRGGNRSLERRPRRSRSPRYNRPWPPIGRGRSRSPSPPFGRSRYYRNGGGPRGPSGSGPPPGSYRGRDGDPLTETSSAAPPQGGVPPAPEAVPDEALRTREEEERRKREHDEAKRDDLTVLVLNLNLKATERDVWKFFSEKAGKVRDIQVIRDSRSGKSKGVSYIEFYTSQSVLKALALTGSKLMDMPITVQASQAEKNRAAKAAKQQAAEITEGGPMKIYVGGLVDSLSTLTAQELKQLFTPFGEIVSVDLHKDPYTGRCKGYGFIQFKYAQEAREAMAAMNGFEIGGRQIKVGYATDPGTRQAVIGQPTANSVPSVTSVPTPDAAVAAAAAAALGVQFGTTNLTAAQTALQAALQLSEGQNVDNERLDEDGGGLLSGPNPRIALMQKLQRLDSANPTGAACSIPGFFSGGTATNIGLPAADATAATRSSTNSSVASAVALLAASNLPNTTTTTGSSVPGSVAGGQGLLGQPMSISANLCLEPLFTEAEVLEEGPNFLDDVAEDVKQECNKYGVVMQIFINRNVVDGRVWVKFAAVDQAVKAHQALNGRKFAGNPISASFVAEPIWNLKCCTTR